jgi:hypothetical protein
MRGYEKQLVLESSSVMSEKNVAPIEDAFKLNVYRFAYDSYGFYNLCFSRGGPLKQIRKPCSKRSKTIEHPYKPKEI